MDEAKKKKESGQALIEYILVLIVAIAFTRFIFFHKEYGIQGGIDKLMLQLGTHLEQDLKSGTGTGGGTDSVDPFARIQNWNN